MTELLDVLIVGAGQAGLATARRLGQQGRLRVQVVDRGAVGDSWLERWDSLTLFTPRRFSALPGLPFPAGRGRPTRTEMARYLQQYAAEFDLPVSTGLTVQRLTRNDAGFTAATSTGALTARQVVIANGPFHRPHIPDAAGGLDPQVWQSHSSAYRRPAQVPGDRVVVVGGGNSAAQLAVELAATHDVTVVTPTQPWYFRERVLGVSSYWWLRLTGALNAGAGSRLSRYVRSRGDAVFGTELRDLHRAGGVRILPHRVVAATGTTLRLADGSTLEAPAVLWCTGFHPETAWIDIPAALDPTGEPIHREGASPVAGLHWMGLPWQSRLNSSIINGVGRDAHATAHRIMATAAQRT